MSIASERVAEHIPAKANAWKKRPPFLGNSVVNTLYKWLRDGVYRGVHLETVKGVQNGMKSVVERE
jgi:hypothetical protein